MNCKYKKNIVLVLLQENIKITLCDDWTDMIEYVIRKFMNTLKSRPHACASALLDGLEWTEGLDDNGFSKKQLDDLYFYYSQCAHAEDPVGRIIEMYKASYSVTKTR